MPGLCVSYWNPRLLRTVLCQLQQQQQSGQFCDVTLQGDGEDIDAHSCVIAACSPYLANLLLPPKESSHISDGKTPTSSKRALRLHGIKSCHLFPLVDYMYTSELKISPGDVGDVLKAARKLQIPEVENLKLEGGKLVRTKNERRLNRSCLSNKSYSRNPKSAEKPGNIHSHTTIGINSPRNSQNQTSADINNAGLSAAEQSNESTLDSEKSNCDTLEIGSSNLNCLDTVSNGGVGSLEDLIDHQGDVVNVRRSHDLLQYILGNQYTQEDAPRSHNLMDHAENNQDLIGNSLKGQNVPCPFSEQNLQRDVDLAEKDWKPEELAKNKPSTAGLSEVSVSPDTQDNLVKGFGRLDEQKKCKVEGTPSQESLVRGQQLGLDTLSGEGLLNTGLDEKSEESSSGDTELLKDPDIDSNTELEKRITFHSKYVCLMHDGQETFQLSDLCDKSCFHYWHNVEHQVDLSERLLDKSEAQKYGDGLEGCEIGANLNLLSKGERTDENDVAAPGASNGNSMSQMSLDTCKVAPSDPVNEMTNAAVDHENFTIQSHCTCETRKNEDDEGSSIQLEYTTSRTAEQEVLTSGTQLDSETCGRAVQECLPPDIRGGFLHQGDLALLTQIDPDASAAAMREDLTSQAQSGCEATRDLVGLSSNASSVVYDMNRNAHGPKKRPYDVGDCFEKKTLKVKLRKTNDDLNWEVVKKVESLNIVRSTSENEYLKGLEQQGEQILNVSSSVSPDVDVGVYSPPVFLECVWPDFSPDSEIEVDILG